MIHIQEHAEEIFWLNRRIQFLTKLNELKDSADDYETIAFFAQDYSKVEKPQDIIDRINEIYRFDTK